MQKKAIEQHGFDTGCIEPAYRLFRLWGCAFLRLEQHNKSTRNNNMQSKMHMQ